MPNWTVNDALNDEEFYKLGPEDQKGILSQIDPEFAGMNDIDKGRTIGKAHLKYLQGPKFASAHPGSANAKNAGGSFGDQIKQGWDTVVNDVPAIAKGTFDQLSAGVGLMGGLGGPDSIRRLTSMGTGAVQQSVDEAKTAKERLGQGRVSEAVGHAGGATPFIGPLAAQTGEEFGSGQYGKGVVHALELLAPSLVHSILPEKVGLPKKLQIANQNNPVEQTALDAMKQAGVRQSVGQQTGSEAWQRREQGLKNLPGSAGRAQGFYEGQEGDIARQGDQLAQQPSPISTNTVGAGQGIQDRLQQRIVRLRNFSDRLYDDVRGKAAQAQQTVQTGTTASKILGPNGQPLQVPVLATFDAPVDLTQVRGPLQSIYDNLKQNMPIVQQNSSPAFQALAQLVTSDATHMSAMDFDKFLGAVKAVSRDGSSPYLTDVSQSLARQVIKQGEAGLNKALLTAGPDVPARLKSARNGVKAYYQTADMLSELPDEPASLYDYMAKGGDRALTTLQALSKVAPKELKTVGRTYLEGLLDQATNEGGFGRADGVKAAWRRMGPETKQMLFGSQLTTDLDNFMLGSKTLLKNLNASGTAHSALAMGGLGAVGVLGSAVFDGLITGDWKQAAMLAGGVGISGVALPNIAARILFSEGGARLLTGVSKLPVRTPAFAAAMTALGGKIVSMGQQQSQGDTPGPQGTPQAQQPGSQQQPRQPRQDGQPAQAALSPYAKPGPYITKLPPQDEAKFQTWVDTSRKAAEAGDKRFEPIANWRDTPDADYDLRGYYAANKGQLVGEMKKDGGHLTDEFKTPYHKTFSNESRYATPDAPHWDDKDRLIDKNGKVLTDEGSLRLPSITPEQQAVYRDEYEPVAVEAATAYGVPKALFLWQIGQESGWDPNAKNTSGKVPALGIAQFQAATAKERNVNPADPKEALYAAAQYMRELYDQTGDWGEALKRYGTLGESVPESVWRGAAHALASSDLTVR